MDDHRTYATYLRRMLFAAACLFLLPVAASEALKLWFKELPPSDVVRRQLASKDLLYLSGLSQDVAAYKLSMSQIEKSDVVVIGSSRALQIRDFFFKAPLVNYGLSVRTAGQLEWATREIAGLPKKPRLAVVVLDPWWFNERYHSGRDNYVLQRSHLSNIYRNTYVLAKGFLSRKREGGGAKRLGLAAIQSNQGFDYYGSFHYIARVTGREKHDFKFENTLKRIDTQDGRFVGADAPNAFAIERWQRAKKELELTGVHVVTVLPPFAAPVFDRMRSSGRYGYLAKLADRLGDGVLDYTDPARLEAKDCEFLDGFHGGEVVNALLLLDAAARSPALRAELDLDRLKTWADANRGLASPTTIQLYGNGAKEVDFLRLGCSKDAVK